MSEIDIRGACPSAFDMVREAFTANFAEGEELGARFCVTLDGEVVVDLLGGFADRGRTIPYAETTLTPIFSTTKAIASLLIARLVDQGKLSYGQRVAEIWPEFAQAGKDEITVDQMMSHQAGLSGIATPMDPGLWLDWNAICERLAAQAPLWPPGTQSGYHPVTFGYLAGEVFRRVEGRTMGQALREDIADPHGLDLWIGLPDTQHTRVSQMMRPSMLPRFGPNNPALTAAFLSKWSQPGGNDASAWRRAEIPSANGHATARDLAILFSALARDGRLGEGQVLSAGMTARMSAQRIRGQDLVLPFEISWGAGVMRNEPNLFYGPTLDAFGHSGWGGSCVMVDPHRGLSCAYVMNRQSAHLIGDPRSRRLIAAVYASL